MGPGWLDRVTLRSGHGGPAPHDIPRAPVVGPKNRRSVIAMGGAAIAGAAAAIVPACSVKGLDSTGSASSGRTIAVDQLGASDNERINVLNELTRQSGGNHSPVYEFANRQYV